MDKITARQFAAGYDIGAIVAAEDANDWLACMDAGMDWYEWLTLPPDDADTLIASALAKHIPERVGVKIAERADGAMRDVQLADGSEVAIRRMVTGDRVGIRETNVVRRNCHIISRVSGVPVDTILDWTIADYLIVHEAVLDFHMPSRLTSA